MQPGAVRSQGEGDEYRQQTQLWVTTRPVPLPKSGFREQLPDPLPGQVPGGVTPAWAVLSEGTTCGQ